MSSHAMTLSEMPVASPIERRCWLAPFHKLEDMAISLALALMMLLPLAEAALRRTIHAGIPASTSLVQHMVLIVGMLGGAIAAREGRLLLLSTAGEGLFREGGRVSRKSRQARLQRRLLRSCPWRRFSLSWPSAREERSLPMAFPSG
jgi:hypothetical protein